LIEALIDGLQLVISLSILTYLVLGVIVGLFMGLLPGLGGPVAIAVLLPFTFGMTASEAFAFLIAMLAVTAVSSDLTAIIIGVPGEPVSAALVLDGHPLAKQGKAGLAIGASLTASLIGGLVGALVLAIAIPFVRPLVLAFTSPEMFMVALLGMAFVASLSEGSVRKGIIVGGLGLLISTVGVDQSTGIPRFTFGSLALWDGLGLVAITVGLFGIPEIYELATRGTAIARQGLTQSGPLGVMIGVRAALRRWWLVVRCSGIGAFVGVLPGLGGAVAQWMAYAHAQQFSPEKELFGKGALDGVIGPGAANNAKEGGSLVPTVAFGVPGTVTMAVLLGAFIMHGVTPGPSMLRANLNLTMSFIWLIVIANCFAVALCFLVARPLVHATGLRGGLLVAPILWLLIIGSYSEKSSLVDVVIMMVAGLLGLAMVRLGWPRAPLLLGLVLGPLAENYLFISVNRYGMAWVTRPLVLLIGFNIILVLALPLIGKRWRRSSSRSLESSSEMGDP
jgi:putative tricarboxylic transport membrane protein